MPRNLFTDDEVVLCAYIAMHGRDAFSELMVQKITRRSLASILMKVQNIAAMLREEGYCCSAQITSLTGLPTGLKGRRTNWNFVRDLPLLDKATFLSRCYEVIEKQHHQQ
jgi:hypothetical protein